MSRLNHRYFAPLAVLLATLFLFSGCLQDKEKAEARRLERLQQEVFSIQEELLLSGDTDKAVTKLEKLSEKHPNQLEVIEALGLAYDEKGDALMASFYFDHALELAPEQAGLAIAAARAHEKSGNVSEAAAAYRTYLRLNPQATDIWRNIALLEIEQQNYQPALSAYLEALRADKAPPSAQDRLNVATLYHKLGNQPQAQRWYEELLAQEALEPSVKAGGMIGLFDLSLRQRQWERALELMYALEELSPGVLKDGDYASAYTELYQWDSTRKATAQAEREKAEAAAKKTAEAAAAKAATSGTSSPDATESASAVKAAEGAEAVAAVSKTETTKPAAAAEAAGAAASTVATSGIAASVPASTPETASAPVQTAFSATAAEVVDGGTVSERLAATSSGETDKPEATNATVITAQSDPAAGTVTETIVDETIVTGNAGAQGRPSSVSAATPATPSANASAPATSSGTASAAAASVPAPASSGAALSDVPVNVAAASPVIVAEAAPAAPVAQAEEAAAVAPVQGESAAEGEEATALAQDNSAAELAARGRAAFEAEDFATAVEVLERSVKLNPNDGEVLDLLSRASYRQGRYPQAERYAMLATYAQPQEVNYRLEYLRAYQRNHPPASMLQQLISAREAFPQDPNVTLALARGYEYIAGRKALAAQLYHEYLEKAPDSPLVPDIQQKLLEWEM